MTFDFSLTLFFFFYLNKAQDWKKTNKIKWHSRISFGAPEKYYRNFFILLCDIRPRPARPTTCAHDRNVLSAGSSVEQEKENFLEKPPLSHITEERERESERGKSWNLRESSRNEIESYPLFRWNCDSTTLAPCWKSLEERKKMLFSFTFFSLPATYIYNNTAGSPVSLCTHSRLFSRTLDFKPSTPLPTDCPAKSKRPHYYPAELEYPIEIWRSTR